MHLYRTIAEEQNIGVQFYHLFFYTQFDTKKNDEPLQCFVMYTEI